MGVISVWDLFLFSKFCSSEALLVSSFVDFFVILGILKSSRELDTGGTTFASGVFSLSLAALGFGLPPPVPADPFFAPLSTSLFSFFEFPGGSPALRSESEAEPDELELGILLRLPLLFLPTAT